MSSRVSVATLSHNQLLREIKGRFCECVCDIFLYVLELEKYSALLEEKPESAKNGNCNVFNFSLVLNVERIQDLYCRSVEGWTKSSIPELDSWPLPTTR